MNTLFLSFFPCPHEDDDDFWAAHEGINLCKPRMSLSLAPQVSCSGPMLYHDADAGASGDVDQSFVFRAKSDP